MEEREPFGETSDDSIVASLSIFARVLLRRASTGIVAGKEIPVRQVQMPLPVSRAAAADYVRLIALWNADRAGAVVAASARPCPACRSAASDFQFVSLDQYPYHACRVCGTWFVPQLIDDRLMAAYFARVPEAKRLSDAMMTGRDVLTRDSDRARFSEYFTLVDALLRGRVGTVRYLDIGCGVGHSVELAAERGWDAVGEELNPVAVATARAQGRNVRQPGPEASGAEYDVVSLFETLEHITDPDAVMAAVARLLAPLGIVVITVPNRASFEISVLRERCFHVFGGFENVGHINLFDSRGIEALLERHGLSLMFTDGQFGSDLTQIFSYLASSGQSAVEMMATGQLEFTIPELAYAVLNNLGPAASRLERALKRSPILIAVACRTAARAPLAAAFATLERAWRTEMAAAFAAEAHGLSAFEVEHQLTASAAQMTAVALEAEIRRRDVLLHETESALQAQIRRRDILLHETEAALQAQIRIREDMNRTLEAHLQGEISRRDVLLEERAAAAQAQIDLRDGMLESLQNKLRSLPESRVDGSLRARLISAVRSLFRR